jgi:hypothetical protein
MDNDSEHLSIPALYLPLESGLKWAYLIIPQNILQSFIELIARCGNMGPNDRIFPCIE